MLSAVPGTEQALRHSRYSIINHVNSDIGFLPKRQGGMILTKGRLELQFLSCSPDGQQCHRRARARAGDPPFSLAKSNLHGNHISLGQGLLFPAG